MTFSSVEPESKELLDLVAGEAPDLIRVKALLEAGANPDWANPDEFIVKKLAKKYVCRYFHCFMCFRREAGLLSWWLHGWDIEVDDGI